MEPHGGRIGMALACEKLTGHSSDLLLAQRENGLYAGFGINIVRTRTQ
jgi:hypothetical protein